MLGFTDEEMVLIRLTMAAWMLCTNDHSLYEIMLGAAPYMPVRVSPCSGVVFPARTGDLCGPDGTIFRSRR